MKKSGKKLLSWLLTPALVLGFTPWISLPANAATSNAAKEVAVNETSLLERDKEPSLLGSADTITLPDHVKRAKDGSLTYSEDGLGTGNFSEEAIEGGTVFRLYNPNSGEHFYTLSVDERDSVVKAGWTDEGIAYDASVKASDSDATPVYRVYNPNAPADSSSHHYTCNPAEAQNLVSLGWRFEGVGFYVFEADRKNGMTVYREYNPNNYAHNYTTDKAEHDVLMEAGWSDENTAWKVKDVQEVGTQKELEAVLATTSLTDLKIATNKRVKLSIPEEDYALVDLTVDAPKASITNAGAFRSIDLRSIAANTWTEKGKNNDIEVNNDKPVHIVVDALNKILSSLRFNGNIDGVNTLEVLSGGVDELVVTAQDPIDVSLSSDAQVRSLSVDAATNVNVSLTDSSGIIAASVNEPGGKLAIKASGESTVGEITVSEEASGTADEKTRVTLSTEDNAAVESIEVAAAGAEVAVEASGESTIGGVTVAESAASTEDAKTTVEVKAKDSATVESVTTGAKDATVDVIADDQGKVGTVKVEGPGNASIDGTSNNTTKVDITDADKDANVDIKTNTVEVETTPDTDTSAIVDNNSGFSIPTSSTNSGNNETSGSIPPKDSGSGSEGGSGGGSGGGSEGGSGGSSGGGGSTTPTVVKVTGVSLDNYEPKVGDKITATLTPSNATNKSSYKTYQWYIGETATGPWKPITDATGSSYTVDETDEGNFLLCEVMGGSGVTTVQGKTTKAVVGVYAINVAGTTNGTVSVAVNGKTVEGDILAAKGDTIKVTVTPAKGYQLATLTATESSSGPRPQLSPAVSTTVSEYTFTMADVGVDIVATFTAKTYSLRYDGNGNTAGEAPTSPSSFTIEDTNLKAPEKGDLVKTGNEFIGWALSKNATEADIILAGATLTTAQVKALVTVAEAKKDEVTVYAIWGDQAQAAAPIIKKIKDLPTEGQIENLSTTEACDKAIAAIKDAKDTFDAAEPTIQQAVAADNDVKKLIGNKTVDEYLNGLSTAAAKKKAELLIATAETKYTALNTTKNADNWSAWKNAETAADNAISEYCTQTSESLDALTNSDITGITDYKLLKLPISKMGFAP